ncbi:MAG: hypothetical protein WBW16_03275 [Bacteroidota bacterium]
MIRSATFTQNNERLTNGKPVRSRKAGSRSRPIGTDARQKVMRGGQACLPTGRLAHWRGDVDTGIGQA